MSKISLANIVFKEIVKVTVISWVNNLIENYEAEPRITEFFFSSDEFGSLFEALGWDKSRRISVEIKLEESGESE